MFKKVQKGTQRYKKVQKGTKRFKKVQKGTKRYNKVQKGTKRYKKVHKVTEKVRKGTIQCSGNLTCHRIKIDDMKVVLIRRKRRSSVIHS